MLKLRRESKAPETNYNFFPFLCVLGGSVVNEVRQKEPMNPISGTSS